MKQSPSITLPAFQQALQGDAVRVLQLIYAAIAGGVFVLGCVVGWLALVEYGGATAEPEMAGLIRWLSLAHLAIAAAVYSLAGMVYDRFFTETSLEKVFSKPARDSQGRTGEEATLADRYLVMIRTAEIVRLAMLEGVAFFGLVVLLLCAMQGVLQAEPVYWLNILSPLFLLAFVVLNFPSVARLEGIFRDKLQR